MSTFDYYKTMEDISVGLAHEIKNPLSIILANIDLLELYEDSTKNKKGYTMIRSEIYRINSLLMNFTRFSKPDSGNYSDYNSFPLSLIIKDLMGIYQKLYPNVEFKYTSDSTEIDVLGNPNTIRQVITNILKNSIEALSDEFIEEEFAENNFIQKALSFDKSKEKIISIDISNSMQGEYTILKISDNGTGINDEDLDKLFKPFHTNKIGGSGLGLFFCKSIISEHNGTIEIVNNIEGGCIVTIKLPNIYST